MSRAPTAGRKAGRVRVVTLVDLLTSGGGAERFALVVATRLDPERFESIMSVTRWPPTPAYDEGEEAKAASLARLEQAGVRFLPLGRKHKIEAAPWAKLGRFLRRERVDVLHSHKFGSNVVGSVVGRLAGVPVVLAHEHTWSYEGKPWRRILDREVISRAADRFIAVSRADQRRMTDVEGIDPSRTAFVPLGIVPPPPPEGRDMRAELGIAPDVPVVGAVSVLRPQKALQVLLHATAQLKPSWPGLQLLLVGDGPEREMLEQLTQELELQDTVRFLGQRLDVADLLQAFDVGVCSSDFEGSPTVILEYMNAALPVVATSVGGIPDQIEPGVNGLLVPRQDPGALARAISEVLADPQRAREMGLRGRERRHAEFDIDVTVGRLESLYLELLQRQGRAVRTLS
jgi:glycosyltransferase involved in cell wall biosynthesis